MSEKKNRLQYEKSPYLLQHQYNPVDWYPWGDEAFEKARKEDKPIFLSIGYSTCHWCHVMEKVCFEDQEVADLMNDVFVSIKVDREERPDIDNIYMTVCQMMTGHGGWPLTVIMTADKKPFYSATYLPKHSVQGRVGMMDFVPAIKKSWETKRKDIDKSADEITGHLDRISAGNSVNQLDKNLLKRAYTDFSNYYDKEFGGFSGPPKFPSPHNYMFLLRYYLRKKESQALEMVENTFTKMRRGGVYDHIGFGFHRYSTDQPWFLPHFEKMLYDEAMLTIAYTECYQTTGNELFAQTVREIIEYLDRDLRSPEGGFYSAEDADSEGEEGKFYVWSYEELNHLLTSEDLDFAVKVWNITQEGNYIEEASRKNMGTCIPYIKYDTSHDKLAENLNLTPEDYFSKLESIRSQLLEVRSKRIRPHLDDKILCDWNGLMIVGLSKAYKALNNNKYLELAENAMDFILKDMVQNDGRLYHRYRDKESAIDGHLDDYAFIIWALIELYESNFNLNYLKKAIELNTYVLKSFWDSVNGGFYFSSKEAVDLIVRKKETYDGAIPSGTSVMMLNLMKLSRITGDLELENKAIKCGTSNGQEYLKGPSNYSMMLNALDFMEGPSLEIVIVGEKSSDETQQQLKAIQEVFIPNKVVMLKENSDLDNIAPYTKEMVKIEGKSTVYICKGFSCSQPVTTVEEIKNLLEI